MPHLTKTIARAQLPAVFATVPPTRSVTNIAISPVGSEP